MTTIFDTVPLGSEVKFLSGGTPRMNDPRYWDGTIPWVSSGEMTQDRICNTERKVTPEGAKNGTRLVPANTVLVVVRGMSLAKEFRVSISTCELTFNQDVKALIPSSKIDGVFLYYYLKSQSRRIKDSSTEASHGTKKLEMAVLYNWPLPAINTDKQKTIVDILSTYDDLIENNRRRIALLEQSARLLYQEWFVRFRFPGHEKVKIVDGVPEGWTPLCLGDLVKQIKAAIKPEKIDINTPYIGLEHIPRRSFTLSTWTTANEIESQKFQFQQRDFLLCKIRPYFHKVGFTLTSGVTSSDAIVMRVSEEKYWHVALMTISSDHFISVASKTVKEGSKMPRADWQILKKYSTPIPPSTLLEKFSETIESICQQCQNLSSQIAQLAAARDLLLPRLMSGEIAV